MERCHGAFEQMGVVEMSQVQSVTAEVRTHLQESRREEIRCFCLENALIIVEVNECPLSVLCRS